MKKFAHRLRLLTLWQSACLVNVGTIFCTPSAVKEANCLLAAFWRSEGQGEKSFRLGIVTWKHHALTAFAATPEFAVHEKQKTIHGFALHMLLLT